MKNIQISKVADGYHAKLHYGEKDIEHTFDDADDLLDFIGDFLEEDGFAVTNIKKLKKEFTRLDLKVIRMEGEMS